MTPWWNVGTFVGSGAHFLGWYDSLTRHWEWAVQDTETFTAQSEGMCIRLRDPPVRFSYRAWHTVQSQQRFIKKKITNYMRRTVY